MKMNISVYMTMQVYRIQLIGRFDLVIPFQQSMPSYFEGIYVLSVILDRFLLPLKLIV